MTAMLRLLLALALLLTSARALAEKAAPESYAGKVVVIPVGEDDLVSRARFEFMSRTLERCTKEGAEAVIFDLDTPGGLLWDTVDLMMIDLQKLKPRSFAYVNPRALSAGAMIAVATDGIYMAPTSSIGAASPVYGTGQEMGEAERAKMNSATMSMARAVAKRKGHDPLVVEAMIDMGKELKVNGKLLDTKKEILTLDADQAVMLVNGKPLLAKAIVKSLEEIKQAEGLKGGLVTAAPTFFESIAIWVTKWAAILIVIGLAGGYLEMQSPGFGLPGFISIAAFSLFFFGHYVAGSLVGHEPLVAVGLFTLGLVLVVLEVFVLPGTLVPAILGFGCLAVALVYAMSSWEVPTLPGGVEGAGGLNLASYATGLRNLALGIVGASVLIILLARYLPQVGPFRRLVLEASVGGGAGQQPAAVAGGSRVSPGAEGRTCSALRPYGTVEFGELRVEAMVEGGYLQSGIRVRVREVLPGKIIVEPVDAANAVG